MSYDTAVTAVAYPGTHHRSCFLHILGGRILPVYMEKSFLLLPDTYFAGIPGRASGFCLRQMRMESDTSYNKAISGPCLPLPFLFSML